MIKAFTDFYGRYIELPIILGGNVQFRFINDALYKKDVKKINITKVSILKYPDINDTTKSIDCGYYDTNKRISIYDFCSNIPIENLNNYKNRFYRFSFWGDDEDCMLIVALKGNFKVNKIVKKIKMIFK
jgi:hypothetical protein